MKECAYRNCNVKFNDDKQYCCRRCKNSESVYRLRDKKPKGKVGRPKAVYKRVNDLTEEDKRILELLFKKVD